MTVIYLNIKGIVVQVVVHHILSII